MVTVVGCCPLVVEGGEVLGNAFIPWALPVGFTGAPCRAVAEDLAVGGPRAEEVRAPAEVRGVFFVAAARFSFCSCSCFFFSSISLRFSAAASLFCCSRARWASIFFFLSNSCCSLAFFAFSIFSSNAALEAVLLASATVVLGRPSFSLPVLVGRFPVPEVV